MVAVLLAFAAIAATGDSPTTITARPDSVTTDSAGSARSSGAGGIEASIGGSAAATLVSDLGSVRPVAGHALGNTGTSTSKVSFDPAAPAALDALRGESSAPVVGELSVGGPADWFPSHHQDQTVAQVIEGDDGTTKPRLKVTVSASQGAVAQDVDLEPQAGHEYSAAVRVRSESGFPVLVELAVHALDGSGAIGDSTTRVVMVDQHEVPITATLEPTADHSSLRIELYVHTVGRTVEVGEASLLVDGRHDGPANLGYQQPRVRYLDDPVTGPVNLADLTPGGRYRIEVSVDTTTDQPWRCCTEVGAIRLGTEDEDLVGGSGRDSVLYTPGDAEGSAWLSPNRIALDRAESTVGGSFITTITAPTEPGPFSERFRLVSEHVTWLPGPVIEVIGSVSSPALPEASDTEPIPTDLRVLELVEVPVVACAGQDKAALPDFCPSQPGPPTVPDPVEGPLEYSPAPSCRTARLFFGDNVLMRYPGHARSDPQPIRLSCSRYEVVLTSTDLHHAAGYQSDQTEERWFLQVLGSGGEIIFTSAPTPDLPDHLTEAEYSVGVTDLTGAVAVVARHTGQGSSANSVAVSAELRPVD